MTKFFTRHGIEIDARRVTVYANGRATVPAAEPKGYNRASGDGSIFAEIVYSEEQYAALVSARAKRAAKAAPQIDAAKAAFETSQPGLIAWAREQKSDFHQSLVEQFDRRGSLSEAQVSALLRSRQQASERAVKVAQQAAISDHVGVVGDRHQFNLTIRFVKSFETAFGMLFIHVMDDTQGNVVVYKGSKELGEKGQSLSLVATVSEHGEREGIKQTIIKRPKVA